MNACTALTTRVLYPLIRRDREGASMRRAIAHAASHPRKDYREIMPTVDRRTRNEHHGAAVYLLQQALEEYNTWMLYRSIWLRTRSTYDKPTGSRIDARGKVDRALRYYEDWM